MTVQLRYYQKEANDAVLNEFLMLGRRSTLLEMATGCGKTVIFAELIRHFTSGSRRRVLVLAHRDELISQAYEKIQRATGFSVFEIQIEKANSYAAINAPVVIASVQSLKGERLKNFPRNHFSLIIVDEAHHSVAGNYVKIIDYFENARVLGVSATLDRLDKKGLGTIYDSIAYVYEIVDGIRDGFLSPIKSRMVVVQSLNLSNVRSRMGDFAEKDLEVELIKKPTLVEIAKPIVELSKDRPTLVFGVSIEHAKNISEIINSIKPGSSDHLSSEDSPERRKNVLNLFRNGKLQYLCNCLLFTEGVDLPFVSCIACARPTQSRALYSQMVGRGTRISPGKEDCLVIDFTDNANNHKLICSIDVLSDEIDAKVRANAIRITKEEETDTQEAVAKGENEELELEKRRVSEQIKFQVREVDPFAAVGIYLVKNRFGGIPPTDKQKEYIKKHGLWRDDLTRRQASMICAKITERIRNKQCTPKMAMLLHKYGFNPDVTMEHGKKILSELDKLGWPKVIPEHLRNSSAFTGITKE